ncbi:four-carbon acid sugar kinase family protein, partial [Ruminococcaceae bacterium OttesenSCG-928-D13]|nr:four-carbon acid sugar kinase family protein [Ruminococcaceae bacterium OttesenSCG-928-D13]
MRRVLVAADDITGADDIGVMYYKSGHPALLYPWFAAERASFAGTEKLVVDTDSRFVPPKEAYRRTYAVVKRFEGQGVDQYFSKQCSVFRGNIGAEFDAVLDATGENFGAVVLGFPDNGRTTLHGVHHVHGVPLSESQFRHDPVNPMAESALAKILSAQTRRPVDNVYYEAYAGGPDALRALVEKHRAAGGYLIFDVRDNADLQLLAGVLKEVRVI